MTFRSAAAAAAVCLLLLPSCSRSNTDESSPSAIAPTATPIPTPSPAVTAADALVPGPTLAAFPFTAPGNEWVKDVRKAPSAPNSDAVIANLVSQVAAVTPAFNSTEGYNASFYTVGPDQPLVDVRFRNEQEIADRETDPETVAPTGFLADIPIPDDAIPAAGTDATLGIWQPSTDKLWELWQVKKDATYKGVFYPGWSAVWGGRIDDVSKSPGYFLDGKGSTATGLANAGGHVRLAEAKAGVVEHALAMAIPDAQNSDTWSYPAQRSDGWNPKGLKDVPYQGQRLHMDPAIDFDTYPGLHPLARVMGKAAQKYGFIIVDHAGAVVAMGESGLGVAAETGVDPWTPLLGDRAYWQVFDNFPWASLRAIKKDWGKPR